MPRPTQRGLPHTRSSSPSRRCLCCRACDARPCLLLASVIITHHSGGLGACVHFGRGGCRRRTQILRRTSMWTSHSLQGPWYSMLLHDASCSSLVAPCEVTQRFCYREGNVPYGQAPTRECSLHAEVGCSSPCAVRCLRELCMHAGCHQTMLHVHFPDFSCR